MCIDLAFVGGISFVAVIIGRFIGRRSRVFCAGGHWVQQNRIASFVETSVYICKDHHERGFKPCREALAISKPWMWL